MGMVTMGLGDTAECKLYDTTTLSEFEEISVILSEEEIEVTIEEENIVVNLEC